MSYSDEDLWLAVVLGAQPWIVDGAAFVIAYLIGSIPFGLILSSLAGLGDIRKIGSGNIGATNVLRTGRRDLALLTLILDAAKGFLPVLFCRQSIGVESALFAGAGAFIGHLFPIWLGFRGGKGVATYIGILTGFSFWAGFFFCAIWLIVAAVTRYSSLSALVAAVLTPFFLGFTAALSVCLLMTALSALLIFRHRKNIQNLISGNESKIGQRAG